MSNYTKGHWKIDQLSIKTNEINIYAKGTPLIAKVFLRDVSINEQISNANLIASAPELLEALELLIDDLALRAKLKGDDCLDVSDGILIKAQDAITKAKGEAND